MEKGEFYEDLSIGKRKKSAFTPYKSTTVLTNLQRGNTETKLADETIFLNFHEKSGQGEITEEQIKALNSVDVLDSQKFTPLFYACYYGQYQAAKLLIDFGANVNKVGPDYITPLLLAAAGGHHEIVKLLLANNAKIDHMDVNGNTALMYAAALNHPHTCNEILQCNPDVTLTNEDNKTAYKLAVENNSYLAQAVIENYLVNLLT